MTTVNTSRPITPSSLDHAALLKRFWRLSPSYWDRKREEVFALAAQGKNGYAIAKETGIHAVTVYSWLRDERYQDQEAA